MTARIPLSVPTIGTRERELLLEAVDSGWIAPAGPQLDAFEAALAERTGRRRAVALSSGTAAMHLALRVAGVGPGDLVICPSLTFIATASGIVACGATPWFVDCDETGVLDPALVEQALTEAESRGARVRAVVPVDLYGRIADHGRLGEIARAHGAQLVVDAAESLGSVREGRPAGSEGITAALSFNGNKIITASSGGAVVTDDDALADHARKLATQAREPVPYYQHEEVGTNYRLSNILAAIGLAQLERLDEFCAVRRAHRAAYEQMAADLPGITVLGGGDPGSNAWLTSIVVDEQVAGIDTAGIGEALAAHDIESRPVFKPMHLQPVFADESAFPRTITGVAERLYRTGLSLPSSPASSADDIAEVCERIRATVPARPARSAAV
ncbi:aminotransferase class I/II-fold pyridoxal phosphate-dependent enzyme [Brachybacterium sp. MASK1Z-5]|uniref:Aminotransferase class I/II-fold pyridoxal phosphate-dependent enzyme n=1 Tax=Brachybacterium halotolerans TaxID=2795215 RepID=A0ABS1BEH5_9MICO|nr:aminotransferase class I/II-fold pyridoxal phosphate-dependent enzyme [Brachybacterium halotolerans]MBK0332999.1 aminotransferase class I/II-fold pyridoxal phosphate-dependent enzyme [Brachybacterium halotolerans]